MTPPAMLSANLGSWSRRVLLRATMIFVVALSIGWGREASAQATNRVAQVPVVVDQGSWIKSGAIFLVISIVGAYAWYWGAFPRLLRKSNPSWPLDAWRMASYGAWITTCLAAYAFKRPLMVKVVEPLLRGGPSALITYFMELILLPLLALVGLLVIWNYRRDATTRARPA